MPANVNFPFHCFCISFWLHSIPKVNFRSFSDGCECWLMRSRCVCFGIRTHESDPVVFCSIHIHAVLHKLHVSFSFPSISSLSRASSFGAWLMLMQHDLISLPSFILLILFLYKHLAFDKHRVLYAFEQRTRGKVIMLHMCMVYSTVSTVILACIPSVLTHFDADFKRTLTIHKRTHAHTWCLGIMLVHSAMFSLWKQKQIMLPRHQRLWFSVAFPLASPALCVHGSDSRNQYKNVCFPHRTIRDDKVDAIKRYTIRISSNSCSFSGVLCA